MRSGSEAIKSPSVNLSATEVEEYLAFERASDERHEYLDGVISAMAGSANLQVMAGESEEHGIICMNLSVSLGLQLRGTPCRAFSKDTKVRCGPYRSHTREGLYAYPDLLVVCGPSQYNDQARDVLLNPTVLIAVLSPCTETSDRGEKFRRYRAWVPTLTDYVLVAQDGPLIDHSHRQDDGTWALHTLEGLEASLHLARCLLHTYTTSPSPAAVGRSMLRPYIRRAMHWRRTYEMGI